MYSRNKQRKEQQLLNLRQLCAKSGHQSSRADDDHNQHTIPTKQSSDSMANRSPNQSSTTSSKTPIVGRNLCRTPKRDNSSTNESIFNPTKSEANPNSILRSVNRSPTVRTQTLRSDRNVSLQSRPTHSPTSRPNPSLSQSSTRSSPNSQTKQSVSQMSRNSDNSVKQKVVKSVNEQQIQQKSLSSTSTTTTTQTATNEPNITPEILFLVKEQAKAIAKINALQKKVERLEQTVNSQNVSINQTNDESTLQLSPSIRKSINNTNSKDRMAISDDSGGEYSRATTTSDDDELSLLLDQIARRSQQLHNSQQMSNRFKNLSISSSTSGINNNNNNSENSSRYMQTGPKWQTYPHSTNQLPHSKRSPTYETTVDHKMFNNYSTSSGPLVATQTPIAPPLPAPLQSTSISALLFEPNVENVLKNLDDIIANEAIDSNRFSNSSTISQTYQRQQTSQHSSHSLYDQMGVASGINSGSLLQNNSSTSSSSNWRLEKAQNFVKQREEVEFDQQMRLNDEWLQIQLKAHEHKQHFRRNNFVDSLEQTFR